MSMPPDSHQILPVCSSGCTYRRLARNRGAGSYVLVLGSRHRCWSYPLVLSSKHRCRVVYASSFVYTHIHRGCPGRRFGQFGIRGGFHGFWRPFTFVFTSVGCQRIGGGYSRPWVVCPGRFHSVHGPGWRSLT
jgi:hypothetical protein